MKHPILILIFCMVFIESKAQVKSQKDSTTKVLATDDYSIHNKNPSRQPGTLYTKDKATNTFTEDTTSESRLELYNKLTHQGDSLYKKNEYANAVSFYSLAFKVNGDQGKVKHRYNAACCYSVLNMNDNAFKELYRIATKGKYYNYFEISSEKKLENLHNDNRWTKVLELIKKNANAFEQKLNSEIKNQ
jgi:hypothetical protein